MGLDPAEMIVHGFRSCRHSDLQGVCGISRRKDEEKCGESHTNRMIVESYNAMPESIRTGHPYQTRLDPPPADPRCCHPPREI